MPKFDIVLKPGEKVPEEFKQLLNDKFGEQQLDKLKRFGGRIQLSLTAPFTDRKEQKKKILIDDSFVKQITSSRRTADEKLGKMTLKQMRELARFVNFPIASKTTVEEARRQLISYLFSSDTWKKISK